MASTLYASRNEPDWGERKVYMRKNPNPNPAETTTSSSNPNPNPNPRPAPVEGSHKGPHRGETRSGNYVIFPVASFSRSELRDLKRRLASELDRVRGLSSWIESRSAGSSSPHLDRDATSSSASRPQPPRPDHNPKRPPGSGKRPPQPAASPRDAKIARPSGGSEPTPLLKRCAQILGKLMKHKHGWVFNEPVDAVAMGLHDYNTIIKRPMDLGTVRSKLESGSYASPLDFAADVRLTFNNALLYNPKGHDVYIMAEQLLRLFEDLFSPLKEKYEKQRRAIMRDHGAERHRNHQIPVAEPSIRPQAHLHPPIPSPRVPPPAARPEPSPAKPEPVAAPQKPLPAPMPVPQQMQMPAKVPTVSKQPKPKARDPHKREMSFREKQKLSQDLQTIPDEKMDQVVQIVRKRNPDPALDGNEIELDFEALDTETLWELDRFVSNCKKMMNKIKRQEAISAASTAAAQPSTSLPKMEEVQAMPKAGVGESTPDAASAKKIRRPDAGEEDVDIGDEMPSTHFPPVEIEKDNSSDSESTSSDSSSSSSSSDSDSRSSSGSDSDGDEAQSPAVGLRPPAQQQQLPRA